MTSPSGSDAVARAAPVLGDPNTWRVTITGELDLASVDAVRPCFEAVLVRRPRRLLVDLGELTFMDSTGIALLLEAAQQVDAVQLENPSAVVRAVVEGTGLAEILRLGS